MKNVDEISVTTEHLWEQFVSWHEKDAAATAVIADEQTYSRSELYSRAMLLAEQLALGGVGAGHRILFDSHSSVDTAVIGLALSKLGAVICPLNYKLGSQETKLIMDRLRPTGFITRKISSDGTELEGTVSAMYVRWQPSPIVDAAADAAEATALVGFTSGTTGIPKAVPHTSAAMNYASRCCADIAGVEAGETMMAISPITSAAGWTFSVHMAFTLGLPLVLQENWDPLRTLEGLDRHQCVWAMCVPTHLLLMMETARSGNWHKKITSMKALAVGGSPNSEEMVRHAQDLLGITVLRMYGMSECLGHASMRLSDSLERRLIYDGVPFPGTHLEAYDSEHQVLPRGQAGQAGVRGPSLFQGYLEGLGAEHNVFTPDGAFLTGDLIVRDEAGYVKVVGRIKDQIIRGGYKIDAAEVENALLSHPSIVEAAIVSKPDDVLGERICAVVSIRTEERPTLEELCGHLQQAGVSKVKWPEFLTIMPALPKTDFGKVDKHKIKQLVNEENGEG